MDSQERNGWVIGLLLILFVGGMIGQKCNDFREKHRNQQVQTGSYDQANESQNSVNQEQEGMKAVEEILKERGHPLLKDPNAFENDENQLDKPNDIIVGVYNNPEMNASDFVTQRSLNKKNTSFFSAEYYRKTNFIKKIFTVNGEFDNQEFNKLFNKASVIYNELP